MSDTPDHCRTIAELEKVLVRLDERMERKFEAAEKALIMQAKEYDRRLSDLNHEAERLKIMQNTYVSQGVYEIKHQSLVDKIDGNSRLIFIGMGILLCLELLLRFMVRT